MGLFRLGRKPASFGLDIGSSAVKVVEIAHGRHRAVLKSCASVPLPRDAISEGMIKDQTMVSDAITEAVEEAGIKATSAIISISGREAITKRVPLPRVSPKELADAILLEAEHHIPFAVDEVFLDYQVVGESASAMDVLLVAVKRVKVLEYVAAVEEAGIEAAVVDLDAFAVQNQFELGGGANGDGDAVALIDIGAAFMKTNVVRGGVPIFVRDVPFGGHHYTEAIAQRFGLPFEKAEAAKHGENMGVNGNELIPALEAVSRELSLEVQRTFDYFASTTESERIGKILLSGGGAKLAGLDKFLSSAWGIPVEIARPFHALAVDAGRFSNDELERLGPQMAVAVGLGLRTPGDRAA
ncbi:MAG: pilus assembly protein PilM [Candidatus Rokubacteria bacterium]|nr:pilus assembly protein PilM [Candidatus Rokubacteria bacterium]